MDARVGYVRDNARLLVGHVLIYAQGVILTPLIIKTAGPTIYGGYVLLMLFVGFIFGISGLGVGVRSRRYLPSATTSAERSALFYAQFVFQFWSVLILSICIVILYPLVGQPLLKDKATFNVWLVASFLVANLVFSQACEYFRSTHRLQHFNYATVAQPYLYIALAVCVFALTRSLSINVLVAMQTVALVAVATPLVIQLLREIGFHPKFPKWRDSVADMRIGLPLLLGYVVDVVLSSGDRLIIAAFLSVTEVGYYAPAYALASLIIFFAKVSGTSLPPSLSRMVDENREAEARQLVNHSIRGFVIIAIPYVVGCAVVGKSLLTLFANAAVADAAWLVMPIVALGTFFYGLTTILANVLFVRVNTRAMFHANAIAAGLSLALNAVLLYLFENILCAALTALVSYVVAFCFVRRSVLLDWPVDFGVSLIARVSLASLAMGGIVLLISERLDGWGNLAGAVALEIIGGIIAYAALAFALKIVTRQEFAFLKKAVLG